MLKSTDIMLHEVLSRYAIADKRMQGSQSLNNFAQTSTTMLAGKTDDGVEKSSNGTDEGIFTTTG